MAKPKLSAVQEKQPLLTPELPEFPEVFPEFLDNDWIDDKWRGTFPGKKGFELKFVRMERALDGMKSIDELLRAQRSMQIANGSCEDEDAVKVLPPIFIESLQQGLTALIDYLGDDLDSISENLREFPMRVSS